MRQSVRITGLDQPMFAKVIETITGVENMFARHVDKNNINEWAPSTYTSHQAIEVHSRYFTFRNDDPRSPSVPLGWHIDPTGKLGAMAGNDLFHSKDNVVLYRTKVSGSTKCKRGGGQLFTAFDFPNDRFKPVIPNVIQIGDIVEVQMSILLAPTNNHRFKTTLKLSAIGILETKYTDVSAAQKNRISHQLLTNAKDASTRRTTQSPVASNRNQVMGAQRKSCDERANMHPQLLCPCESLPERWPEYARDSQYSVQCNS